MGYFAWLSVGVCVCAAVVTSAARAAPGPATGTFPSPPPPAASASASSAALPPPPPPPPAASPTPAPPASPSAPASSPAPALPAAAPAAPAAAPPAAAPPPAYAGYPPPGYGYYYPQPYYLPPPPRVKQRFPDHAAVSSSPFVDMIVASVSWQNRVSQFFNVGVQGGVYLAGRVRLTANLLLPSTEMTDDYNGYDSYPLGGTGNSYYYRQPSNPASLFYGAGVGIVVVDSANFVMAPGVAFSRTDVSDYGSAFGVALPFEWVTGNGLRVGLEFDAGRAFGGRVHEQCFSSSGTSAASCGSGPQIIQDRPSGTSILLQFQLGFGFNHPDELPPLPSQSGAPYGWPAAPPLPPQPAQPPQPVQPPRPAPNIGPAPLPG